MAIPPTRGGAATPGGPLPPLLLLLLGAIWGGTLSVAKLAVVSGVPPVAFVFWYALGAGLVLLAAALARGMAGARLDGRHLVYYGLCGVTGIAAPQVNSLYVLGHVPAGVMAVVITTVPVFTYGLALAARAERFRPLRCAGIACGFAGALVLVLPRGSLPEPWMAPWAALGLLTPACYAAQNVLAARLRPPDAASPALAAGMLLVAAAGLLPAALLTGQLYVPGWPPGAAEGALLAQLAATCVAYTLYFELLRLAGPVYVAQVAYIVTLTGIAWGMLFFGERHSLWIAMATALIFAGVALVNLRRDPAARPAASAAARR